MSGKITFLNVDEDGRGTPHASNEGLCSAVTLNEKAKECIAKILSRELTYEEVLRIQDLCETTLALSRHRESAATSQDVKNTLAAIRTSDDQRAAVAFGLCDADTRARIQTGIYECLKPATPSMQDLTNPPPELIRRAAKNRLDAIANHAAEVERIEAMTGRRFSDSERAAAKGGRPSDQGMRYFSSKVRALWFDLTGETAEIYSSTKNRDECAIVKFAKVLIDAIDAARPGKNARHDIEAVVKILQAADKKHKFS
jgi:hypothetical protein